MPDPPAALVHHVKPGERVRLADLASNEKAGLNRKEAERQIDDLGAELSELQELLYGSAGQSVLIVLQGLDTSGKDGAIRRAHTWLNPQSCRVSTFKVPTAEDAAHDFLWRVHQVVPRRGFIAIFNRSHYEDVLAARVHGLVPREVWSQRYDQINDFERLLTQTGTIVLKFFLHIAKEEQEQRLLDREKEPNKGWKLSVSDWEERRFWDDYVEAYEDMLNRCSTEAAPWYVVPADHKWFRDLAFTTTVVAELRRYRQSWESELLERGRLALSELKRYRAEQGLTT